MPFDKYSCSCSCPCHSFCCCYLPQNARGKQSHSLVSFLDLNNNTITKLIRPTMSKSKNTSSNNLVFVLTLVSVDHGTNHQPEHRTVGVYASKVSAALAAGSVETDYGTFDSAIKSMFGHDHIDHRMDPPDNGCLLQIGSWETGEGDYVQLNIEKFTIFGDTSHFTTATSTSSTTGKRKKKAETTSGNDDESSKKKPKSAATAAVPRKREIAPRGLDDICLIQNMKDQMKPAAYKRLTQQIKEPAKEVEVQAAPLRRNSDYTFGGGNIENLFKDRAGDFWGLFGTRDYMRPRLALAEYIHDNVAIVYDTPIAWEAVLWHYQEMLRLCASDNLGLRDRFPFLLMHLDRDDDAFCFIEHWIKSLTSGKSATTLHEGSQEGEWIYGHQNDARLLDIFRIFPKTRFEHGFLPILVALACIKMRLVAADDHVGVNTKPVKSEQKKQKAQLDRIIDFDQRSQSDHAPSIDQP